VDCQDELDGEVLMLSLRRLLMVVAVLSEHALGMVLETGLGICLEFRIPNT
jgi:hypothetical protein